jgi:hypothetical protein
VLALVCSRFLATIPAASLPVPASISISIPPVPTLTGDKGSAQLARAQSARRVEIGPTLCWIDLKNGLEIHRGAKTGKIYKLFCKGRKVGTFKSLRAAVEAAKNEWVI